MSRSFPLLGALLAITAAGIASAREAVPADRTFPTPEAKAGPYRVAVDRISANRNLVLTYGSRRGGTDAQSRRMAQLQLGVFTPDKSAAAGLAIFLVKGVTADAGGRIIDLPSYGGVLENPNDTAVVRAYVYVPGVPLHSTELRSLEGEIVSYDHSAALEVALPVAGGELPRVVEQDGVTATLRELKNENGSVQVHVTLEAPSGSALVSTVNDGTYGVALLNGEERAATPNGGTMLQPRPNQMDFRLGFGSLRGTPGKLVLKCLHRGGARHVYPFRIEHIPIPDRRQAVG